MNNMNLLKDMKLFVRVVRCGGLAAAGRELGMTPSSVTMRIKNLEKHYQVKLLKRTTRSINLTDDGIEFYKDCLKTLEDIDQVESKLRSGQEEISGSLRISATSDLGRQHIAPVIDKFVKDFPNVQPFLNLSDAITNIAENNIDIAIRYGVPNDSLLIAKKLVKGRRVLCASPEYLKRYSTPIEFHEIENHLCLSMVQVRTPMTTWYFNTSEGEKSININPSRSCDDGALIRQWAMQGYGIALKSIWDVANDLKAGRLVSVLDKYSPDYQSKKTSIGSDLFITYQDRKYIPKRTRKFIEYLKNYFTDFELHSNLSVFDPLTINVKIDSD